MAFLRDNFNNVSSGGGGTIKIWSYINTSDTLATIEAANYFNPMRFALNQNDLIFLIGSDGSELVRVTSLVNTTSVTVTAYDSVPAGTIVNADVSAAAGIEFSKMEALASGELVVGNAGVPTVAALSGDAVIDNAGALTIDESFSRTVSVAMTAAEFIGSNASPVLLVPAPGAGKRLIVTHLMVNMTYVSATYANGSSGSVQYGDTADALGIAASQSLSAATVGGWGASTSIYLFGTMAATAVANMENQGLYWTYGSTDFITGDGTFVIDLTYTVGSG